MNAWTPLQLHSDHVARIVRCRALSGCCVAASLVASPVLSIAWELGSDTAAVLPGVKLRQIPLSYCPEVFYGQHYYVGAIV